MPPFKRWDLVVLLGVVYLKLMLVARCIIGAIVHKWTFQTRSIDGKERADLEMHAGSGSDSSITTC